MRDPNERTGGTSEQPESTSGSRGASAPDRGGISERTRERHERTGGVSERPYITCGLTCSVMGLTVTHDDASTKANPFERELRLTQALMTFASYHTRTNKRAARNNGSPTVPCPVAASAL